MPQPEEKAVVSIRDVPTVAELVDALCMHKSEIILDEWRPIADHVRGLMRACIQGHDEEIDVKGSEEHGEEERSSGR